MRRSVFFALVFVVVFSAQTLFFYRGVYIPQAREPPQVLDISIYPSQFSEYVDQHGSGEGKVLFDSSHRNDFSPGELNVLVSRILARGFSVEYLKDSEKLGENLTNADAFVVISPAREYSKEEVEEIKKFVERGGRLLLGSDPERDSEINTLAGGFGILFWDDFLYNLKYNDGNFKYIYLTDFADSKLMRNLSKLVFYSSGSIYGNGIVFTDNNTYSSTKGIPGRYSPVVLSHDSRVLGLGDITFLTEPYNVLDNNIFISNIADFLTNTSFLKEDLITKVNITVNATESMV